MCRHPTPYKKTKAFASTPLIRIGSDSFEIKEKRRTEYFSFPLVYAKFVELLLPIQ
jgi:hypothetical protein